MTCLTRRQEALARPSVPTWAATPLAMLTIWSYGTFTTIYGLVLIGQDDARWSGPTYSSAVKFAPQDAWGVALALFGALVLTGSLTVRMWIRNVGLLGIGLWCCLLSAEIINAATVNPTVSWAGTILLCAYGVNAAIVAFSIERKVGR